jgi:DNA-binding SARP family transcriptional activator
MDFRILGPLEVRDEGRAVALGGSRPRALLALLLLHANEVLTAERMIDALWGETAPSTASSMLHVQVSRLRKALPDGAARLVTRERGYVLLLELDELDAHRFEDLLGAGGRELAAGRPGAAAEVLDRALALWRGAPLGDLGYEAFAQAEVARLQELHAAAHEQMIDARLALGHHADVIGPLQALIGEHPYRERLRGQLMLALYRCDRQADALQVYHDARRLLVDELGIEPALALEAPVPAPMPAPAPAPAARGDARRLVTVVVAELSDAGALAERIDPESLHAVLERFAAACTGVLERHGAEADAGAGDVVVGVFGSGIRHEDDPLRAVRAALELRERCAALAADLEREVGSRPDVAFGVSSGEVFSHPGARPRGKPMHVALALAAAARGGEVLADDDTRRLSRGALESEAADAVAIRGRSADVPAFRLLGLAAPDHTPRGPFVARRAELGALRAAVGRARAERACRRVTVVGPPGIGKSRLARELIRTLEGDALVTVGHCRAYGDGTTSGPLAELVTGITGDDPAAWLAERLAGDERAEVIAGRVLAALGMSDAAAQAGETAWAVRRVLEAAARERPLVAVIDDAHWAEPELLDLLEYTLAFSGGAPILLLGGAAGRQHAARARAARHGRRARAARGPGRRRPRRCDGGADRGRRGGEPAVPRAAARRPRGG